MRSTYLVSGAILAILLLSACTTASVGQRRLVENALNEKAQNTELPPSLEHLQTLQAGQWVSLFIEAEDGTDNEILRTIRVVSVTGKPDGANEVKIEVEDIEALRDGKWRREGYIIENFPAEPIYRRTPRQFQEAINTLKFVKVVRQDEGGEQEDWPQELLMFSKDWLRKLFYFGSFYSETKEVECDNGYLSSKVCLRQGYNLRILNSKSEGRVYLHHAIPVVGFLDLKDTYRRVRAVAFGTDAQSELSF